MALPGIGWVKYVMQREIPLDEELGSSWNVYWQKTTLAGNLRAKAMAEFVEDGWSMLDIGCGDGLLLATLKGLRPRKGTGP